MFQSLSDVVKNFGIGNSTRRKINSSKKYRGPQQDCFDFLQLIQIWPEIVGPGLTKHTIPLKIQNNCLTVLTNHSVFSQQVSFMEEALITKVIDTFPTLKSSIVKIKFIVDSAYFERKYNLLLKNNHTKREKEKFTSLHPQSPQFKKYKKEATELFSNIDDTELKQHLESIFIQLKS